MFDMQSKRAFTLIELLVVVVIIGLLAAVGVPKLYGLAETARISNDIQSLNAVQTAVSADAINDAFVSSFSSATSGKTCEAGDKGKGYVVVSVAYIAGGGNTNVLSTDCLQGAIIRAIKSDAGSAFLEKAQGSKSSNTIFQSKLLEKYAPRLMVAVASSDDGIYKTLTLATTEKNGVDSKITIYTYRGKPIAAGDIPKDGEYWGGTGTKLKVSWVDIESVK